MIIWCGNSTSFFPELLRRNRKPSIRRHFSPAVLRFALQMETSTVPHKIEEESSASAAQTMSKNAQKRLLKQQRFEAKKAEKKAQMKEQKKKDMERRRREWDEKLSSVGEQEREKLIEDRKGLRKQRMEKRSEERGQKLARLREANVNGQNVVIDLEFAHLMSSNELHSLVQQIMYCYAINGRCPSPAHIWLTGCRGEMQSHLQTIPGYDKWIIEKEDNSYMEAFHDQTENLVYLTADSENLLDELDPRAIYIVGGLVDRNRWKGITMNKAKEQGIRTAKLPIGEYLKMSSSQVLTVNQVVEILLKFIESKDWKTSFFQVIPLRKRFETVSDDYKKDLIVGSLDDEILEKQEMCDGDGDGDGDGDNAEVNTQNPKRQCL